MTVRSYFLVRRLPPCQATLPHAGCHGLSSHSACDLAALRPAVMLFVSRSVLCVCLTERVISKPALGGLAMPFSLPTVELDVARGLLGHLNARREAELAVDVSEVGLDSARRDEQSGGDFPVGQPLTEQPYNVIFGRSE